MSSHSFSKSPGRSALVGLATLTLFSACMHDAIEEADEVDEKTPSERRLFVFSTSYVDASMGVLMSVDPDSMRRGPDSLKLYNDGKVLVHGNSVYVLERGGADNIVKYNPSTRSVVYQEHLGDGVNPSDLLIREDGTAIVALTDSDKLAVINSATGKIQSAINISAYAHKPDSVSSHAGRSPHAFALAQTGDTLLVGLQRRNADWMQVGEPATILLLNAQTLVLIDTLQAPAYNAANLWVTKDAIYFACPGRYDTLDGGLYRWRRGTGAFTTVFTEAQLGGNVNDIACNEDGTCLISAYGLDFSVSLRSFSLDDGSMKPALTGFTNPTGGLFWDAQQKVFFVGERSATASGVVRLGSNLKPVGNKLSLGLPPANFSLWSL